VTGSLPLLVWLVGQDGSAEALTGGPATFWPLLATHQLQQPFLIQIDLP
jgi:hypothetical protein